MRRDLLWTLSIAAFLMSGLVLVLVLSYQHEVRGFRRDVYQQCVARLSYDESSQATRAASLRYWQDYIQTEKANVYIGPELRAKRMAGAQRMVDALTDTLSKSVPGGCRQYQP